MDLYIVMVEEANTRLKSGYMRVKLRGSFPLHLAAYSQVSEEQLL